MTVTKLIMINETKWKTCQMKVAKKYIVFLSKSNKYEYPYIRVLKPVRTDRVGIIAGDFYK